MVDNSTCHGYRQPLPVARAMPAPAPVAAPNGAFQKGGVVPIIRYMVRRVALTSLIALALVGCEYEITQHTKMDGSLPAGTIQSISNPARSELVGHWKAAFPPSWPDVDFALEIGSSGRGLLQKINPAATIMNDMNGSWKWRYSNDGYLTITANDGRELLTSEMHRVSRNTMCFIAETRCELVMQRVK